MFGSLYGSALVALYGPPPTHVGNINFLLVKIMGIKKYYPYPCRCGEGEIKLIKRVYEDGYIQEIPVGIVNCPECNGTIDKNGNDIKKLI